MRSTLVAERGISDFYVAPAFVIQDIALIAEGSSPGGADSNGQGLGFVPPLAPGIIYAAWRPAEYMPPTYNFKSIAQTALGVAAMDRAMDRAIQNGQVFRF